MDGSQWGGRLGVREDPWREPEFEAEREWGLSAGQVVTIVLAIVAGCEVVGAWLG
jgi:hypothetical protein